MFKETGTVPNVVNLAKKTPATSSIVVRHIVRPGTLAHTLDAISAAGINVQEMENIVFDGALAAVARINVEGDRGIPARGDQGIRDRDRCHRDRLVTLNARPDPPAVVPDRTANPLRKVE